MGETSGLRVWANGTDHWVARDLEHLYELLWDHAAVGRDEAGEFTPVDPAKPITIYECSDELTEPETGTVERLPAPVGDGWDLRVTRTAEDWVRINGAGLLASTEW